MHNYQRNKAITVHIILFIITVLVSIPIIYMLIKSTQDKSTAISPSLIPGKLLFSNFARAWNEYNFKRYILNTLIITVNITLGKTIISLFAAVVLVYFKVRGKVFIFGFILITLYIPVDLIAIGLFDLVSQQLPTVGEFFTWIINPFNVLFKPVEFGFAWANNYNSVIVPFLASATGTFLFIQHFRSIPRSFVEVAYLEGAGPLTYLFKVLLPNSWNTIGALWVIQFVFFWNQYFWPRVIISDNDSQVVQIAIRSIMRAEQEYEWGVLMAAAIIVVTPPMVCFGLLLKQLQLGVSLSTGK